MNGNAYASGGVRGESDEPIVECLSCLADLIIDDVWIDIFCFADVGTLASVRRTCQLFKKLTHCRHPRIQTYFKHSCNILSNDLLQSKNDWYCLFQDLFIFHKTFHDYRITLTNYHVIVDRSSKSLFDCENGNGLTPLMMAACINSTKIMDLLFSIAHTETEIDCNEARECDGQTALHLACKHGSYQSVTYLLSLSDITIDNRTTSGKTALYIACEQSNAGIVKLLLDKYIEQWESVAIGCDRIVSSVNAPSTAFGMTPLMVCPNAEIADLLLNCHLTDTEATPRGGLSSTALVRSMRCRRLNKLERLLQSKGIYDTHVRHALCDHEGQTALHLAFGEETSHYAKAIMNAGREDADRQATACLINKITDAGDSALSIAINKCNPDLQIIRMLIDNGADVNALGGDEREETPLIMAITQGKTKVCHLLLDRQHSLRGHKARGEDINKALLASVNCHNFDIMTKILSLNGIYGGYGGVDILFSNERNMNVWHCACGLASSVENSLRFVEYLYTYAKTTSKAGMAGSSEEDHADAAHMLLTNQEFVDWYINKPVSVDGETAYHLACRSGNQSIVKYLVNDCRIDISSQTENDGMTGSRLVPANDADTCALRAWLEEREREAMTAMFAC